MRSRDNFFVDIKIRETYNQMQKKLLSALCASVLLLVGCASQSPQLQQKADYREFSDSTWLPETEIRAPLGARQIGITTMEALKNGIHAFYGTHDTRFSLMQDGAGIFKTTEDAFSRDESALSWCTGSDTLYRDGIPITNEGGATAEELSDGRVLIRSAGATNFYLAVAVRAYDVSGKPIRQFLRDGNNQPAPLAWFIKESEYFPSGSVAYLTTWWLGDDEVVMPAKAAFTGAKTFDQLVKNFSSKLAFCLSYVNHQNANPFGIVFEPLKRHQKEAFATGKTGNFTLRPVKRSVFCEDETRPDRLLTGQSVGTWTIRNIRGTRVMQLTPDSSVAASDIGVQPVNADAVSVGFAEIKAANVQKFIAQGVKNQQKTGTAYKSLKSANRIVPVRILHSNQPIVDFRLRFNDVAAGSIRSALLLADQSKRSWEEQHSK